MFANRRRFATKERRIPSPDEQDEYIERGRFERRRYVSRRTLAIIAGILIAAAVFNVYGADETTRGFIIWNRKEAYLFVTVDRRGNHASFLELPWIIFKQLIVVPIPPDEVRRFLLVIHATGSGEERHTVKLADIIHDSPGGDPAGFTPVGDHIFAHCPQLGGVCRWASDHFEPATEQERSIVSPEILVPNSHYGTDDFDNRADGWSRRVFVAGPKGPRSINAVGGDHFTLLMTNVTTSTTNGTASIEILRSGKAVRRIAVFETYDGLLTPWAYRHAFRDAEQ